MDRKVWSFEEKIAIVLEILRGELPVTEICHKHQVTTTQAYHWRDLFLEAGKKGLTDGRSKDGRDSILEENRRLKELVGSLSLIIETQKKVLGH